MDDAMNTMPEGEMDEKKPNVEGEMPEADNAADGDAEMPAEDEAEGEENK